jgi:sarcosine oxidase gamma subunit
MAEIDQDGLWRSFPDLNAEMLVIGTARIRIIDVGGQFLVSGALDKAADAAGVDGDGVGALGRVSGTRFSVRLARDRLLIVSDVDAILTQGWHEEGYAVTEMTGAFTVFEISGLDAIDVVKRASTIGTAVPSPSAAVSFAGIGAVLYRHGPDNAIRVHVERGLAAYLWQWFTTSAELEPARTSDVR